MSSTPFQGRYIDNPTLITPKELLASLPKAFERGLESGDLLFFESTTHPHAEDGIDFEIRKCPALLHKPPMPTPHFQTPAGSGYNTPARQFSMEKFGPLNMKPIDPFMPPYAAGLCLGRMEGEDEEEYVVMLNKFSVVKHHFLLITKNFQSQNTPLTPPDLVLAYQILLAAQSSNTPFMAFFNCGDRSGASQAHKHLQFIPLSDDGGLGTGEGESPIERATRRVNVEDESKPFSLQNLPYAHFIRRFPTSIASSSTPVDTLYETLQEAFMTLLDLVILAVRHDPADHPRGPPSYNVLLTTRHLTLIPRSREKYPLVHPSSSTSSSPSRQNFWQGNEPGNTSPTPTMSINSLGFAGMFLVKSDEEGEAVASEGCVKMLRGVGVPKLEDGKEEMQSMDDVLAL